MTVCVLFHSIGNNKHCPDGFASALAFYLKYGDDARYIPVCHGDPPPPLTLDDEVYIVDFSYSLETLEKLSNQVKSLFVIDHHYSAEKKLQDFKHCHFDMTKSGAVLAYEHVFPDQQVPDFFLYVQDRDLWQHRLPNTRTINCGIAALNQDFGDWAMLLKLPNLIDYLAAIGQPFEKWLNLRIQALARNAKEDLIAHDDRYRTITVEIKASDKSLASDLCAHLLETHNIDYVGCFYQSTHEDNQMRAWSLRSSTPECNVAEIAEQFGGGGHKQASGFQEVLKP